MRYRPEDVEKLRQTGFLQWTIPGYITTRAFGPDSKEDATRRRIAAQFVANGWPFQSIDYNVFRAHPPTGELPPEVKRLYLGDGSPEQTYRLEPLFHFFRTGEKWRGSSMYLWHDDQAVAFFRRLLPRIERELPF